ncbi:MAG: hypothetical protein ACI8RZ_005467 [Myxococcota bacterium]|jgi:uncharacterized protein YndB with AHSA1/START domain
MLAFETTTIDAPPAVIWAALTDAGRYPEWSSTVTKVEGSIVLGQKITVYAKISPTVPSR